MKCTAVQQYRYTSNAFYLHQRVEEYLRKHKSVLVIGILIYRIVTMREEYAPLYI